MPEQPRNPVQQLIDYLKGTHNLDDPTMTFSDQDWTSAFDSIRDEKAGGGRGRPYGTPFKT